MLSTRYAGFKGNDLGSERAGPWPSRTGDSSQVPRPSLSHTWVLRVRLLVGPAWVGVHRDRHGDSGWHALPSRVLGPRAARAAWDFWVTVWNLHWTRKTWPDPLARGAGSFPGEAVWGMSRALELETGTLLLAHWQFCIPNRLCRAESLANLRT